MTCDILFRVEGPVYHDHLAPHFQIHDAWDGLHTVPEAARARIRTVVTNGTVGLTAAEMDALPALGLISTVGTGYEAVDVAAARARGISVTHAAGVNAVAVAEYGMGMVIALVRKICAFDDAVRTGTWRGTVGTTPLLSGRRMGIFGMGGVGIRMARLAEAFGMEVAYCSRSAKDVPWTRHDDLLALAGAVDILVIAAPGGPTTHHAVSDRVLNALGPHGYVVNLGRGSIIHTPTLTAALRDGRIAGAALDVFEEEPDVPSDLRAQPNVLLSPHIAGLALDVQRMSAALMKRNIDAFLAGTALISPVPDMA